MADTIASVVSAIVVKGGLIGLKRRLLWVEYQKFDTEGNFSTVIDGRPVGVDWYLYSLDLQQCHNWKQKSSSSCTLGRHFTRFVMTLSATRCFLIISTAMNNRSQFALGIISADGNVGRTVEMLRQASKLEGKIELHPMSLHLKRHDS